MDLLKRPENLEVLIYVPNNALFWIEICIWNRFPNLRTTCPNASTTTGTTSAFTFHIPSFSFDPWYLSNFSLLPNFLMFLHSYCYAYHWWWFLFITMISDSLFNNSLSASMSRIFASLFSTIFWWIFHLVLLFSGRSKIQKFTFLKFHIQTNISKISKYRKKLLISK